MDNDSFPKPEIRRNLGADFEMRHSSDDENIISQDSGMELESMENDPVFNVLRSGDIKTSFQLTRRGSRTRSPDGEAPADSESSPNASPRSTRQPKRLSLFDSPHTPRSLVRRLSQGKESPRWLRKGGRQPRSPAPEVIKNPFTPSNRHQPTRLSQSARQIRQTRQDSQSRYKSDFLELARIGSGDFGDVFKVQNRLDGCFYAIKRTKNPIIGSRVESKAIREVCAHAVLDKHNNVVRYYSAWSEGDHMLIQSEYCDGGSLGDEIQIRIQHSLGGFNHDEVFRLLNDTTAGLAYIHQQKLAHMDIKPGNILRCLCDDNVVSYKIGDLGHVTPFDERIFEEGDCRYAAKELIQSNSCKDLRNGDIFSLGLTAFEAATLHPLPKNGDEWHQIRSVSFDDVLRSVFHSTKNPLSYVISRMLSESPKNRLTAHQAHDLLTKSEMEHLKRQIMIERNNSKFLQRRMNRDKDETALKRMKTT